MSSDQPVVGCLLGLLLATTAFSSFGGQTEEAGYVGSQACAGCHEAEYTAWRGSHHDLAMAEVSEQTVLGDFADAKLTAHGVTSIFFRRDGGWYVRTDGPDGELHDYRIAYTFGWYPLQQYLIEFPRGHVQSLGLAWDSRPQEQGGQRWFHLYPDEEGMGHRNRLHWTSREQTWNYQCAECHSTELRKRYDLETALDAYHASQRVIAERPESHHNIGLVDMAQGKPAMAQKAYRTALRLDPGFVPAYANLADLYRSLGADAEGEEILRAGLEIAPESADLHHALGLLYIRGKRLEDALGELRRAAELGPENPRYPYVYAVALKETGDVPGALEILADAYGRHPANRDILVALVTINRDAGNLAHALSYAQALRRRYPDDRDAAALLRALSPAH